MWSLRFTLCRLPWRNRVCSSDCSSTKAKPQDSARARNVTLLWDRSRRHWAVRQVKHSAALPHRAGVSQKSESLLCCCQSFIFMRRARLRGTAVSMSWQSHSWHIQRGAKQGRCWKNHSGDKITINPSSHSSVLKPVTATQSCKHMDVYMQ